MTDWEGPFTTQQAVQAGFDRADVRSALRRGRWVRLRAGIYVTAEARAAVADHPPARHAQDIRALMMAMSRRRLAAAESSAAQILGLESLNPPGPDLIVATDDDGVAGTHRDGYFLRAAHLPSSEVWHRHAVPVTSPARTAFDLAANQGFGAGVIAAESAYRQGLLRPDQVGEVLENASGCPGVENGRQALLFADPKTESVLETQSRISMRDARVTMPETQVWVQINGRRYRVDFVWDHLPVRVFGEADGLEKYLLDGDRMARYRAIRDERQREHDLLCSGAEIVRWGWAEARDPVRLGALIRAAFHRAIERGRGRAG